MQHVGFGFGLRTVGNSSAVAVMGALLASCSNAPRDEEVTVAAQVQALSDSIVDDSSAGVTFSSGWT